MEKEKEAVVELETTTSPADEAPKELVTLVKKGELKTEADISRELHEKSIKKITVPSIGRRILADFSDLVLAAFLLLVLFFYAATPVIQIYNIPNYNNLFSYQLSSGLFIDRQGSDPQTEFTVELIYALDVYYGVEWSSAENAQPEDIALDYQQSYAAIYNQTFAFYHHFLSGIRDGDTLMTHNPLPAEFVFGAGSETEISHLWLAPPENYVVYFDGELINDPTTYFDYQWFNYRMFGLPNSEGQTYNNQEASLLFQYQKDADDNIIYNAPAIPHDNCYVVEPISGNRYIPDDKLSELRVQTIGVYFEAMSFLVNQSFYAGFRSAITLNEFWGFFVCYTFVVFFFYLLFPMIFKNGETLGKMMLGVGLINKHEYAVNRWQVLFRFLVFYVELTLTLLSFGLFLFICFLITVFTKGNRAPHDFIAGTMVMEKGKSVWYKSKTDEEMYNEQLKKELEKHAKVDIDSDNPNREYL